MPLTPSADEPMRLTGGQRALWVALMAVIRSSPNQVRASVHAQNAIEAMIVDELNKAEQQPQEWIDGMNEMQEQLKKFFASEYGD